MAMRLSQTAFVFDGLKVCIQDDVSCALELEVGILWSHTTQGPLSLLQRRARATNTALVPWLRSGGQFFHCEVELPTPSPVLYMLWREVSRLSLPVRSKESLSTGDGGVVPCSSSSVSMCGLLF